VLDALRVADSPAQAAAVIRFHIPQLELPTVMGPAVAELMAVIGAQGITPTGPLFNHYLSMDGGTFDFEVGVPVSGPVAPTGRVTPGELPAAKVVRTTYHGPYTGLHHAWREFGELGKAQGYVPAGGIWERYVVGPETNPDPSTWRTELNQPVTE
jgi:effector-binding domain-containing protein